MEPRGLRWMRRRRRVWCRVEERLAGRLASQARQGVPLAVSGAALSISVTDREAVRYAHKFDVRWPEERVQPGRRGGPLAEQRRLNGGRARPRPLLPFFAV